MNLRFFFCMLAICLSVAIFAQDTSPESVVKASLKAYNNRDIDAFMSLFDENIKMYNFQDSKPRAEGLKAVRNLYQEFFEQSPDLHSKILNRIVFENKVIDHEYITGGRGSKKAYELVFIYEIEDGKIVSTTAMRP